MGKSRSNVAHFYIIHCFSLLSTRKLQTYVAHLMISSYVCGRVGTFSTDVQQSGFLIYLSKKWAWKVFAWRVLGTRVQ